MILPLVPPYKILPSLNLVVSLSQAGFERYDFTDLNARFVRIFVNTNSQANEADHKRV